MEYPFEKRKMISWLTNFALRQRFVTLSLGFRERKITFLLMHGVCSKIFVFEPSLKARIRP